MEKQKENLKKKEFKGYLEKFLKYRYLLQELVIKDVKIKYRRSVLGLAWTVLNPLLMMLVITAVFSRLFKFNIEYFPAYYLVGSLIFNFNSEATILAMNSIRGAAGLIKKVYIPKYIFPMEKVMFAFVNALFSLIAVAIVLIILRVPITWTVLLFPIPLVYTLVFSMGLGLILATMNVFFRDTEHLYGVFVTAWMYLTPIIYPMDILPEMMQKVMAYNPLYHYVEYFRQVIMYNNIPGIKENIICAVCAMVFLIIGLLMFKLKQDKFILYI